MLDRETSVVRESSLFTLSLRRPLLPFASTLSNKTSNNKDNQLTSKGLTRPSNTMNKDDTTQDPGSPAPMPAQMVNPRDGYAPIPLFMYPSFAAAMPAQTQTQMTTFDPSFSAVMPAQMTTFDPSFAAAMPAQMVNHMDGMPPLIDPSLPPSTAKKAPAKKAPVTAKKAPSNTNTKTTKSPKKKRLRAEIAMLDPQGMLDEYQKLVTHGSMSASAFARSRNMPYTTINNYVSGRTTVPTGHSHGNNLLTESELRTFSQKIANDNHQYMNGGGTALKKSKVMAEFTRDFSHKAFTKRQLDNQWDKHIKPFIARLMKDGEDNDANDESECTEEF